jgi:hypothetical protein
MKAIYSLLFTAIVCLGGPVACGGGGGNPGTCDGSDAVCGAGLGNPSAPGITPATDTVAPPVDAATAACAAFGSQAEAQAALLAGARELDPDNNGIACDQ